MNLHPATYPAQRAIKIPPIEAAATRSKFHTTIRADNIDRVDLGA